MQNHKLYDAFFLNMKPICDSGGGLYLKIGGRYYLRGIVSASILIAKKCDVNNYAVYTDVAKYLKWLKQIEPFV